MIINATAITRGRKVGFTRRKREQPPALIVVQQTICPDCGARLGPFVRMR